MIDRRTFLVRSAVAVVALLSWSPLSAWADAGSGASAFVAKLGDDALALLQQTNLPRGQQEQRVRELLRRGFAMKPIGRYVLGRYWRQLDDKQETEYLQLFEEYIVKTYSSKLNLYAGLGFDVSGERSDGDSGSIVNSEIRPKDGPAVKVQWRVRKIDGDWRIIDVMIEGVSMALTQQSEFASVIRGHGGSLDGLIADLRKKVAALQ